MVITIIKHALNFCSYSYTDLDVCVREGADTNGNLVTKHLNIEKAEECAELCRQNLECELWTLTLPSFPHANYRNNCFLKKGGDFQFNNDGAKVKGVVSGKKCGK